MMSSVKTAAITGLLFFVLLAQIQVHAATVEYELIIAEQEVNITGKSVRGMTVNGSIPGPTLRFKEGDIPAFTSITG